MNGGKLRPLPSGDYGKANFLAIVVSTSLSCPSHSSHLPHVVITSLKSMYSRPPSDLTTSDPLETTRRSSDHRRNYSLLKLNLCSPTLQG